MKKPTHPVKIIFFDIDDTLYYKAEKRFPESITQRVLPALKAKGIIPAIATGRCFGAFPDKIKPMLGENGFETFVTINGQYNFSLQKTISKYPLATARIEQVIEKLKALHIEYAFVCHDQIATSAENAQINEALIPIKENCIVDPLYYLQHEVIQMLAFYPPERADEVANAGVLGDDLKEVRWHEFCVDLLDKRNSKAQGIRDVLQHFGLKMENAMAFGDGLNDLEMLSEAGFGVAMGNGEARFKNVADYITLPIEQDGILDALLKLEIIT